MHDIPEAAKALATKRLTAATRFAVENLDTLPDSAWIRVQVVAIWDGSSVPTVWRKAKNGQLPKPVKLSAGVTAWSVGALRQHYARLVSDQFGNGGSHAQAS